MESNANIPENRGGERKYLAAFSLVYEGVQQDTESGGTGVEIPVGDWVGDNAEFNLGKLGLHFFTRTGKRGTLDSSRSGPDVGRSS